MNDDEAVPMDRFTWEKALRDDEDVLGVRLLVLLTLGIYMRADGSNARPSRETLAAKTGLHSGTVGRHLSWARAHGYLEQVTRGHRRGDGICLASVYQATCPQAAISTAHPNDIESAEENLYRAEDGLYRAEDGLYRAPLRDQQGLYSSRASLTNTALRAACEQCDSDGLVERDGHTFACTHPLLSRAGSQ